MAQFPALPLFTDAWIADTKHLSIYERGLYMDLLVLMWRTPECRVPDDRKWLAERLGIDAADSALERIINEFCRHPQGTRHWLIQKRLNKEFSYLCITRKFRSSSAKARWNKDKKSTDAMHPTPPKKESSKKEKSGPKPPPLHRGASASEPTAVKANGKHPIQAIQGMPSAPRPVNASTLAPDDLAKAEAEALAWIEQQEKQR